MRQNRSREAYNKFANIVSEFSMGLTGIEFTYAGNAYNYMGIETPHLLLAFLGNVDPVNVRSLDGTLVPIANADMPDFFGAMYAVIADQRAAFAAKYAEFENAPDDEIGDVDETVGWSNRSPALAELKKPKPVKPE